MAFASQIEVRPRSTGEILDEAWRVFLARPIFLLALSLPFTVPWAVAFLVLLTQPVPSDLVNRLVMPVAAAALLPVTGFGAGACQEAFRRLAQGKDPALGECIWSACRRGVYHAMARAAAWSGALIAAACVVMPGIIVWVGTSTVHAVLADGDDGWMSALARAGRESQRYPAKALIATLTRSVVLLFAAANLHVVGQGALWAASNLVGVDLPRVAVLATLSNPLYDTALLLFCWLLLVPYGEAVSFLLHQDARARFEGLDLRYRVHQVFPIAQAAKAGAGALSLLVLVCPARAASSELDAVRHARQGVAAIASEMTSAEPFPGASRWAGRLQEVGKGLDQAAGSRGCRWFHEALAGFAGRNKQDSLRVVHNLQSCLDIWEVSLARDASASSGPPALSRDKIKELLPQATDNNAVPPPPADQPKSEHKGVHRPHPATDESADRPAFPGSGGNSPAVSGASGIGPIGWKVLFGLVAAVLVYALARTIVNWKARSRAAPVVQVKPVEMSLESLLTQADPEMAHGLWQKADELAGRGQFLEATRSLYLAVLAFLHQAGLIRYEAARTNYEYIAQLRPRDTVQRLFVRLTGTFEVKWYGERACRPDDFHACRQLAEQIQREASP